MKVEAIESTRSPQGKVRVRFDDGSSLLALPSAMAELGLYQGMELPDGAMESIKDTCAKASARERAVRIIAASTVSKRELEHRLLQKGEREEDAKQAVQWLEELKLLDDAQAAEQIVRSGAAKGYGAARIKQMLYEKRIPKEYWDAALELLPPQDGAIDSYLQRRFRGKKPDRAECKRAADALARRGHNWSDIRSALERYAPDEEFDQ
ncbi:MAG: regulatory protein RecX [Oscillospiraceae bacterium]|nr:regulatory protein RecX [Oscillospiraceae bacterium]